ncbi:MAG: hypothetical protein ACRES4_00130 [Nevskiales bacterium]
MLAAALVLTACTTGSFRPRNLAKTEVDQITDLHILALETHLRALTIKLYRRNPSELRKRSGQTLNHRLQLLFGERSELRFAELDNRQSTDAMLLAFDDGYKGDRVFAVMAGLTDMLRRSYDYKTEYFALDVLDQQKLYNSARNIEVLVWRLSHKRDPQGQLYLLSNEMTEDERPDNLSFERLFGKMIALQDMMAEITADSGNRGINRVVQGAATMIFLPI